MRLELSPVEPFLVVIGDAMDRNSSVDNLGYSLCYFGGTIMISGSFVILFLFYILWGSKNKEWE
jgi:hypothetical protein